MFVNTTSLLLKFKARFKKARCWIIILKQVRAQQRKSEGKATNTAFNCLCRSFCRCHQWLSQQRVRLVAVPLADSAAFQSVNQKEGRSFGHWSLSYSWKSQAFNIDLAPSIYKDRASFVHRKGLWVAVGDSIASDAPWFSCHTGCVEERALWKVIQDWVSKLKENSTLPARGGRCWMWRPVSLGLEDI